MKRHKHQYANPTVGEGPPSAGEVSYASGLVGLVATPSQDPTEVKVSGYPEYVETADLIGATLRAPTADPPQEYPVTKDVRQHVEPNL